MTIPHESDADTAPILQKPEALLREQIRHALFDCRAEDWKETHRLEYVGLHRERLLHKSVFAGADGVVDIEEVCRIGAQMLSGEPFAIPPRHFHIRVTNAGIRFSVSNLNFDLIEETIRRNARPNPARPVTHIDSWRERTQQLARSFDNKR